MYGCRGAWYRSSTRPLSTISPAYMTAARAAELRHDGQVVRDEDQREPEVAAERCRAARGSAPAPSRRARSSARPRSAPSGCRRAPSRSPPAGACRRTARAGSAPPGSPGSRPTRADRRSARARREPVARPCSSSASTIWEPIVRTGLRAFIAPWKTIAMSTQRCGRTLSSPSARRSLPSRSTLPETLAVGGSSPSTASAVVVFPQPDSPTRPSRSPAASDMLTPCTAWSSGAVLDVEPDVEVLDLEERRHSASGERPTSGRSRNVRAPRCATRRRGLRESSSAPPIRLQLRMISATRMPGGTIAHQAPGRDRGPLEGVLDHLAQRDRARVAEPEERERRLVEDRDRDGQHRVRDQERRHLGQHVPSDDPPVARPERPGALHVDALAHALHLRAQDARRARPEQDPDHDDDVADARPPDRGDDDHQRHVRDDDEVVGDPHQDGVDLAAEVARGQADGAADQDRHDRRREAHEERDPRPPHQQRDHVDAPVVEPERVSRRGRPEGRADLLVQAVGRDPRREQGRSARSR